ncbi:unnamed protein product, partial [Polarella glacialis]
MSHAATNERPICGPSSIGRRLRLESIGVQRLRHDLDIAAAALAASEGWGGLDSQQRGISGAVEASRCSGLLRSRLMPGPVLDVGGPSMFTAWLLREARIVISLTRGRGGETSSPLAGAPGLVEMEGISLQEMLEALHELSIVPGLVFLTPTLFLGGGGNATAEDLRRADLASIRMARDLFPELSVAGAMLSDEGREVPHWALPSLIAPLTGSVNNMILELPCWAAAGCPLSRQRPLLSLVMIVKDESRRIRETVESVASVADRVVILDTGSTDGTQQILRETCARAGLSLELFEERFADFSTTRNRVLELARNRTEFVLMLSGDETVVGGAELRRFVEQHSGFCGGSEDLFNVRVLMGPSAWYWSERLFRSDNHAELSWPSGNNSWRYVGMTHEAYINPSRTMDGDLFIQYVGDTDPSVAQGMPEAVAGSFHISHDAERSPKQQQRRLRQDVRLLEGYLDKSTSQDDAWQYTRAVFYLAQSHRSLGNGEVAGDLWARYLGSELSTMRQFSYLRYGAYLALGQLCAEKDGALVSSSGTRAPLPADCRQHFEEAHKLCPRVEPLVYLALSLPPGDPDRLEALQRAERVAPLQASTGHCALYAEPALYSQLEQLLRE